MFTHFINLFTLFQHLMWNFVILSKLADLQPYLLLKKNNFAMAIGKIYKIGL